MNAQASKVLRELEITADEYWNVPRTSAEFLNFLVRLIGAKRVLEVGTSNGYSGLWLAEALSSTDGRLWTVESHEGRFEEADKNFERAGLSGYVELIKGHAPEVLGDIEGEFDMVFLDATKGEYVDFAEVLVPRMRSGGLLVADNCTTHAEELREFMAYVRDDSRLESILLPFDHGLMLCIKK